MTKEILKERKIRDNLKKIYILNKCRGSDDHKNWTKQRNKVNKLIANAKNKDALKDCEEAKGNSAKMWKAVNKAMNKKPKPNTNPDFVKTRDANGDVVRINCKNEIANVMNKQFTEMGSKLAEKLDTTEKLFSDYLKNPNPKSFFYSSSV